MRRCNLILPGMIFIVVVVAVLFARHPLVPLDVLLRPQRFPVRVYLICLGSAIATAIGVIALFMAVGVDKLKLAISGAGAILLSTPIRDLLLGVEGRKLIGEDE